MSGQVAIVTGAAQGLGAAVCHALAQRGWVVAAADVNAEGAEAVARGCGASAFAIAVDLAAANGPQSMVDVCMQRTRRIDALVNCAAVAPAEAFLDMTSASWE